jgi:hypothetical protein
MVVSPAVPRAAREAGAGGADLPAFAGLAPVVETESGAAVIRRPAHRPDVFAAVEGHADVVLHQSAFEVLAALPFPARSAHAAELRTALLLLLFRRGGLGSDRPGEDGSKTRGCQTEAPACPDVESRPVHESLPGDDGEDDNEASRNPSAELGFAFTRYQSSPSGRELPEPFRAARCGSTACLQTATVRLCSWSASSGMLFAGGIASRPVSRVLRQGSPIWRRRERREER